MGNDWDVVSVSDNAAPDDGWEVASVSSPTKSAAPRPARPTPQYNFVPDGRAAVLGVYPNARITDNVRKPGTALALANPDSYHLHTNAAVDVAPIPGMSFDDYINGYKNKGYSIIESRDEVNNPSPWATGPHWHVVLGTGTSGTGTPPTAQGGDWDVVSIKEPTSTTPENSPIDQTHSVDAPDGTPLSSDMQGQIQVNRQAVLALQSLVQDAAKSDVDPQKAAEVILKHMPAGIAAPHPEQIAQAITYMRKTGPYFAVAGEAPNGINNPETVVSHKNDYDPTKDPNNPDYNPSLNAAQRFQQNAATAVNEGLGNILAGAASLMGITDPNDPRVLNSLYSDPHGWARTLGVPVGEFAPLLAAPETGVFDGMGVGGAAVRTGLEGAGVGYVSSGGDPAKMTEYALGNELFHALGPVGGTLLKEGAPAVADAIEQGVNKLSPVTDRVAEDLRADPQADPSNWIAHPDQVREPYVKPTADLITSRLDEISKDWKGTPERTVVQSVSDLSKKEQAKLKKDKATDNPAFYDSNGRMVVIADNVDHMDDVPAILFHEALGHHGLATRYGDGLTDILDQAYDTNWGFRQAVEKWLDDNPTAYRQGSIKDPMLRQRMAAEEVLADIAQKGPPQGWFAQGQELLDNIIHYVRNFARDKGMDLRLTDGEIRAIVSRGRQTIIIKGYEPETRSTLTGNRYITAWHGSPHDFDEFDHSKIGTGEGAQVYGHGSYFAEEKGVAEAYRRRLAPTVLEEKRALLPNKKTSTTEVLDRLIKDGKIENGYDPDAGRTPLFTAAGRILDEMQRGHPDIAEATAVVKQKTAFSRYTGSDIIDKAADAIKSLNLKVTEGKGKLYKVELPDDADWLHYDLPVKDMPEGTKSKLREMGLVSEDRFDPRNYSTGAQIYNALSQELGQKGASNALHEAGIAGVKYLDAFSRDAGQGSSNYVVFHDQLPKIINKYMQKRKVGNLSADAMTSTRDVEDFMRNAIDQRDVTPEMRAQSHVETRRLAEDMGLTASSLVKKNPELLKPEVLFAARKLLDDKTNEVLDLSDRVAQGKTSYQTFRRAVLQQAAVQEWVMKAAGNAGRALNALGIKLKDSGVSEALSEMDLGRLNDEDYLKYLASRVSENRNNPAAVQQALKDATNKYLPEDWLTSYHYAAMLSGYKSLEHNVFGHFFGSVLNNVTHAVAGTLGTFAKVAGVREPDLLTLRDLNYRMYGYANILADSSLYQNTLDSLKNGRVKDDGSNATWANGPQLPKVLTWPENLHSASYTFFGEAEKAANLYQMAARMAEGEGLKGAKLFDRIQYLAHNPTPAMAKQAMLDANAVRFMGKGDLSDALRRFLQQPTPDKALLRLFRFGLQNIAPFSNIAEQKLLSVARYLPVFDKLDPYARQQWASGIQGKQLVLSRYMMGLTALMMAYNHQADAEALGSDLVAEIPVLNLMKTMEDALTTFKKLNAKSSDSEWQNGADAVVSAVSTFASEAQNETFLKSVGDYFVARSKAGNKGGDSYWGRQATSWVPYSAALREANNAIDPYKRDTSGKTFPETVENNVTSIVPGLSTSLPVRHDQYGRPMEKEVSEEKDPAVLELQRLSSVTGQNLSRPISAYQTKKEQTVPDPAVTQNYQRVAGEYTLEAVRSAMQTPEWSSMSDEDKAAKVRQITKEMHKAARSAVFSNDGWEVVNVR